MMPDCKTTDITQHIQHIDGPDGRTGLFLFTKHIPEDKVVLDVQRKDSGVDTRTLSRVGTAPLLYGPAARLAGVAHAFAHDWLQLLHTICKPASQFKGRLGEGGLAWCCTTGMPLQDFHNELVLHLHISRSTT